MTLAISSGARRGGHFDIQALARPACVVVLTVVAYHESLRTLLDWLSLDTPLADLALVPGLALVVAATRGGRAARDDIHDRQLDWILGLVLIAGALLVNRLLPARDSASYWQWRIDLLSMPFFVAGVVCLLFGARVFWHQRLAISFLFLAWPWPYYKFIDHVLEHFTRVTIHAVGFATEHVDVAQQVSPGTGDFVIHHHHDTFTMSVMSSCSGANGLIGLALVGTALAAVSRGTRGAKALWLGAGAILVWVLNIVRIIGVFTAGTLWGRRVAVSGFHPYLGLVVFAVAIVVLMAVAPLFGVTLFSLEPRPRPVVSYRPRAVTALIVLAFVTMQIASLNSELRTSDLMSFTLGPLRTSPFAATLESPAGWSVEESSTVDWASQYFGDGARWVRYVYQNAPLPDDRGPIKAPSAVVYADVISTSNRRAMSTYGVEACYQFHDDTVRGRRSVELGSGVMGVVLSWEDSSTKAVWTSLYWHWPVRVAGKTRYERITLIATDPSGSADALPAPTGETARVLQLETADRLRASEEPLDPALVRMHRFLTAFAQELVRQRTALS